MTTVTIAIHATIATDIMHLIIPDVMDLMPISLSLSPKIPNPEQVREELVIVTIKIHGIHVHVY